METRAGVVRGQHGLSRILLESQSADREVDRGPLAEGVGVLGRRRRREGSVILKEEERTNVSPPTFIP